MIDGSSSIDAADFELERNGLTNALANPLLLPRDGSAAVTVIQFADSSTRIEVPYTRVASEADVNQILLQLASMTQLQGLTNPGDAVNQAVAIFDQSGNPQASQSLCLATDGLPNSGSNLGAALAAARASTLGVESFGVIAVEDPPNFDAGDFEGFYGPLVFGGSNVTVVRNAAEFANTVGGACFPTSLRLVALEVNQAVQNWQNEVRLIRDKATLVRAFVETDEAATVAAIARLRGFRGGTELPGSPLVPINAGGSITAPMDATAQRENLDSSLNFRLPSSWTEGTVTLEVEGVGSELDCQEAAGGMADCRDEVSFEAAEPAQVRYVALSWSQGNQTFAVTGADIDELIDRQLAISPISAVDAEREFLAWGGATPPVPQDINEQLESMRFWDLCWPIFGCERLYYGAVTGPSGGGGRANGLPGTVSSGYLPFPSATSYGRNRHVHEIAHNLGFYHAPYCGASASVTPLTYDTFFIGMDELATLGPMNSGDDELVYGFDNHRSRVVDPNETFELMSYCGGRVEGARWISRVTYEALLDANNARFGLRAAPPKGGAEVDYLVVRGSVDSASGAVDLLPIQRLTSSMPPPLPATGDYLLRFFDQAGQVLGEISFASSEAHDDASQPGGDGVEIENAFFLVPIPAAGVRSVEISKAGSMLAARDASAAPPSVTLTAPQDGALEGGDSVTFEWQSGDADGDALSYLVQYSRNDGGSWKTLALDWPGTSYTLPRAFLEGSSQARFRVLASDGFTTEMGVSGTFTVANNAPRVEIVEPETGATATGVQLVVFAAEVGDREDGSLPASSIAWSSDLDGALGTGEGFELLASDLSEGIHRIEVMATDSAGATSTDTIELRIGRIAQPPCAETETSLCLNGDRFQVDLEWVDQGTPRAAQVAPARSADSGLFWFSGPDNWEVLVKVLDGCAFNDRFWVFAASATNVEYRLRVRDTRSGAVRTYFNPAGNVAAAFTDTDAFPACSSSMGSNPSSTLIRLDSSRFTGVDHAVTSRPGPAGFQKMDCLPSDSVLCLNANRYLVEVEWKDFQGGEGRGQVVPFGTVDSGLFWFFGESNWEFLVKVLDGCSVNDRFWVFAAATTNVEYTLRVMDTESGAVKEYFNPLGTSANPVTDTDAFDGCP